MQKAARDFRTSPPPPPKKKKKKAKERCNSWSSLFTAEGGLKTMKK